MNPRELDSLAATCVTPACLDNEMIDETVVGWFKTGSEDHGLLR